MMVMAQLEMCKPIQHRPNPIRTTNPVSYSTATGGGDPTRTAGWAWWEYTGIPSAFAGGAGAVGLNVANQSVQVQSGASIFSKTKYGFRAALALETVARTAIIAGALTVFDPYDKWDGGLDEVGFFGGNNQPSLPSTMSGEEQNAFIWGLKQGHLGFLF